MTLSARKLPHCLGPLDSVGWLAGETQEFRDWVLAHGRWLRFEAGRTIYIAGDVPDGLHGLGHGTVEVTYPVEGAEPVTVHRAEPGFWLGESAILAQKPRTVSFGAVTECLIYLLPVAAIERRLREVPDGFRPFSRLSHANATLAVRMLAETIALTPRARFCRVLLRQSRTRDEAVGSQESLGALAGLRVTTTKRIVGNLVASGAVRSGYGRLILVDRAAVEALANEEWDAGPIQRGAAAPRVTGAAAGPVA